VTTSNGSNASSPVLDTMGDGSFRYISLGALVHDPAARSYILPGSGGANAATFGFRTFTANAAASPGDNGLMLLLNENPLASGMAIVRPGGR
jgi:hypothetical protein